jgi:dipeptide transport system permease protein
MAANVAVPALSSEEAAEVLAQPTPLAAFWAAFRENRGAVIGLVVISAIALIAIFADFIAPHSPIEQFRDSVRAPPIWDPGGTCATCWEPTATATTRCRG